MSVDQVDLLAAARGLHLVGLCAAAGVFAFRAWALRRSPDGEALIGRDIGRIASGFVLVALLGGMAWLAAQSDEPADVGDRLGIAWYILGQTRFGHVLVLRGAMLLAAVWVSRRSCGLAASAGLGAVALQAAISHGAARRVMTG